MWFLAVTALIISVPDLGWRLASTCTTRPTSTTAGLWLWVLTAAFCLRWHWLTSPSLWCRFIPALHV